MIVDAHTHAFPENLAARALAKLAAGSHTVPFADGTARGLCASMQSAGIDASVVLPVATSAHSVPAINRLSEELNGKDGLVWLGGMHPAFENVEEELKSLASHGVRGIKLHPVFQDTAFDAPETLRILEKCAKYGLTVVTHAGFDVGFPGVDRCSPRMIRHALAAVPEVTLVLAHMGAWRDWDAAADLLADSGVYIDTSFSLGKMTPAPDAPYTAEELQMLTPERFTAQVRVFGADHTLFGTDCPWGDQKATLDAFLALPLTEEEKRAILYENAAKLFL